MSHQQEISEEIGHLGHENRMVAILVSVLALFLAIAATAANSMRTEAITENLNSANLWVFFQSNRIQRGLLQTVAESVEVRPTSATDPASQSARAARVAEWNAELKKFDSDPQTQQGREQLMEKAREAEHKRDRAMEKYHHFEVSAAAFEVGIVLASATVVTEVIALAWIAGLVGLVGAGFLWLGAFAPELIHLFG